MPEDKRTKWRNSMLSRFGGDEAKLTEHMSSIGRRGGAQTGPKGFAHPNTDPVKAGSKGGYMKKANREK